ncbi:Glycosyltransferase involved in cell wall bisynthesis [Corynebacterium coyleae]|uniref:Glycosyltransferase family 4 protein n=1 Tax=Corynebacterium coyleae TaxID=53374 RepID=A0ABX8KZV4_9CORY|nr:glycosyltransferase family 4 protein [Corynebacterium coyleae]QXB18809.1 glycosyltransferase family 4 protein [Corynebacterium coyleae]WJY80357.1 Glycosyl transferases group 1 [Corynebacterium coyleae]SEB41630.1 Glycosyltransferase involved in cell wall bisynthesis [Corynebacterium coyleae]
MNPNFDLPLPRSIIAPSYSDDDLVTRLYLENEYLKSHRKTFTVGPGLELPSGELLESEERYCFTRQFLRETSKQEMGQRHLVIANEYPSKEKRYANGFVHRRVKFYQEAGLEVDVVAFGKRVRPDVYDFDGVKVLAGYVNELAGLISTREYASVSVHFPNSEMWKVLKGNIRDSANLIFYIHGYEARNWSRLPYGIRDVAMLNARIERSLRTEDVWKEIVNSNVDRFIFVSDWWREAAMDDLGVYFGSENSEVIHNFVDTRIFDYEKKDPQQRFKLLWVRSANAHNYGADIAAEFLRQLKLTPVWADLEVLIVGDGQYFNEFDEFRDDEVVTVRRDFIKQEEIADLHKRFGMFIVPTRFDTQGVSRDEAMSSGLVPITCPVTAVPEFADSSCSILFAEDEVETAVEEYLRVARDPELFSAMSRAAAQRSADLNGAEATVAREIELMTR